MAATTSLTLPAHADTNWTNTVGGDWGTPGNWSAGLPTSAINALFNTGSNYTVTLPGNEAANNLTDTANGILLQLNAHTLTLSNTLSIGNGTSGSLTLDGGTLNQLAGNISLANGTAGSLLLQDNANVTTAGQLLAGSTAGNAGTALTITANSSLSTGTASLAINSNSSLSANIAGTWNVNGDLGIGGLGTSNNGGTANLTITGNVTVSGTTDIWNNTTLGGIHDGITLNGGTLNTGAIMFPGIVSLNSNISTLNWLSGTINLTNSNVTIGFVNAPGTTNFLSNLILTPGQTLNITGANAFLHANHGNIDVNGGTLTDLTGQFASAGGFISTFESNGTASFGGGILDNPGGTINILTGASVTSGLFSIVNSTTNGTLSGTMLVNNATLLVNANATLGGTTGNSTSYATLAIQSAANATFTSNLTIKNFGLVNLSGGSLNANAIQINSGGALYLNGGSLTSSNVTQTSGSVGAGILHTTSSLSVARQNIAATTVGGTVLFAGGSSDDITTPFPNVVYIYNSSTGIWTTATLSQARVVGAAITVGTQAIFAGGGGKNGISAAVDIYDNSTGHWSNTTLPQPRLYLYAAAAGTKAIFAGGAVIGIHGPTSYSNAVDIYDTASAQWTTASLSQARYAIAPLSIGSKALFAGGISGGTVQGSLSTFFPTTSNVVDLYDDSTGQWSNTTLSQARYLMSATTVGNKVIYAGGATGMANQTIQGQTFALLTPTSVVDIYDNSTNQWTTTALSQARFAIAATTVGSKAFFAGGMTTNLISPTNPPFSSIVDIYNDNTGQWSTATLSQARSDISALTVGNMAVFAGGDSISGQSNVVDLYDDSTGLWSTSTLSVQAFELASAVAGSQAIFAGGDIGSDPTKAVDIFSVGNATLSFGNGTNNVTAYTLSFGSLSAKNILMNSGGSFTQSGGTLTAFTFTQSGGSVNFSNATPLNVSPTGTTVYTLSGGTLTTPSLLIQTNGNFTQTAGTLTTANITQTGGNATFSAPASLTLSPTTIANYTFSGGTLTSNSLTLQGTGKFHFDGGTLNAPITGATSANLFLAPANGTFNSSTPLAVLAGGANASYAGVGSSADGDLATAASLLFGTNTTGIDTGPTMRWRTPTTTDSASNVVSDILDLSGMVNDGSSSGQTDLFVLEMSYNPTGLTLAQQQALFLGTSIDGLWVNAIAGNFGTNTGIQFLGPWTNDDAHTQLGAYGVDTTNDVVWAVLNHNTEFAATPEPGTLALLTLGTTLLLRRKK